MNDLIVYIFKSAIWIAVFYGIYRFFFRQETFFRFNRGFLLTGMIASFILPLCQLRYPVEVVNFALSGAESTPVIVSDTVVVSFDRMTFFLWAYSAGALALFLYYGLGLNKIRKLIHKQDAHSGEKSNMIYIPGIRSSFSFFGYVFMDPQAGLQDIEKEVILAHETAHIEQLHWIDVLLAQLVCIFQWFNPFAWLYLNAVKQNHEFLADRSVIDKGYSPAVYQAVLINSTFQAPVFAFTNSFAYYHQFKRIEIMKKNISKPAKKLAVLLLLPAFAGFLAAFAQPEYHYVAVAGQVLNGEADKVAENSDSVIVVTTPRVRKTSAGDPLVIADGQEISTLKLKELKQEDIESFEIFKDKDATSRYGEKGKNGVINIKMKKTTSSGSAEDTTHVYVVGYGQKYKDKPENRINAIQIPRIINAIQIPADSLDKNAPLIIVDGKEYTASLNDIEPKTIESISILKDESATALYGEKGKNGVIFIQLKETTE